MIVSAFLYVLKKLSFLRMKSINTQKGKIVIAIATTIPNGFRSNDSMIFPSKSKVTARVVPQDGQA
jgi:hypothetical protein